VSYVELNPIVREIAERVLTPPQLEAFQLECDGRGTMAIARRLLVTRSAVRDRLHNAHTRLLKEGLRMDDKGEWYREAAA
jgi:DNA-binding NarL/FixJ family response regulator